MRHATTGRFVLLIASMLTMGTPLAARAQSTVDEQQLILARIQTNERAMVFKSMDLDDKQVAEFTPVYDAFQAEYKKVMDRGVALIESFAANYHSLTDDDAARLLRDWFEVKADEDRLIREYARKLGRILPPTKVLRFVQIENKLSTTLRLAATRDIPLAK